MTTPCQSEMHITDQSNDRAYFVLTPQLVWALCTTPYQLTLWTVIKMIAGETGTCTLDTRQLATLAMMSVGKCHAARKALLQMRLLDGHLIREPGYPRAVWHLSIPDLWIANTTWRQQHHSLKDRIAYKERQAVNVHLVNNAPQCSPGERDRSPGETKKIHEEEPYHDHDHDHDHDQIWITALGELRMMTTSQQFNTWIAPLRLTHLEPGHATLTCPTTYVQEWCSTRLDPILQRTLAGVAGDDALVVQYHLAHALEE